MNFIVTTVIVLILVTLLFLLRQKKNGASHIFLVSFYWILLTIFLNFYAGLNKIFWLYTLTNLISLGSGYLIGAVIYLYTYSLTESIRLRSIWLILLPFLLYLILVNIPFALSTLEEGYLFDYLWYVGKYGDAVYLLELLVFGGFILKAFQKYQHYKQYLLNYQARIPLSQIKWGQHMLIGIMVFIVFGLILNIYLVMVGGDNDLDMYITLVTAILVTVYITYHGLYQSKVFLPENLKKIANHPKKNTSFNNAYSPAQIEALKNRIQHLLEDKKLYLNQNMALADLANELQMPDKKVSVFINQQLHTNFYSLINEYRLKEFKKQVLDPKNKMFSTIAIANQCGFKSKTSFYTYFKKQIGMTPAQYVKVNIN